MSFTGTRLRVVHESACPDIGPICAIRDEPPHLHDQVIYVTELRGIIDYGITDVFGIEAQLPVKLTTTTIEYRRLDDTPFVPDYLGIHHRNETLVGIADPWLRARWSLLADPILFSVKAGLSIPLGRTEPDPFALGDAGQSHQHIQFGTGTFDPLLSVELSSPLGPFDARFYAQTQLVFYQSQRGYRAGNRYASGAQLAWPFLDAWSIGLSADAINEQAERWSGTIKQEGNLGRTDFLLGGSLTWDVAEYAISASAKTPVYQHIIEYGDEPGQLTYPLVLILSVTRAY